MTELKEGSILGRAQPGSDSQDVQDEARPRGRTSRWLAVIIAFAIVAAAAVLVGLPKLQHSELTVAGVDDGATLNADASADLEIVVDSAGSGAGGLNVTVDGKAVAAVDEGDVHVVRPEDLAEGEHTVVVTLGGRFGAEEQTVTRRFSVDTSGPSFTAPAQLLPVAASERLVVTGLTDGVSSIVVNGAATDVTGGVYRAELPPTTDPIDIVATDSLGNTTRRTVVVTDSPSAAIYPASNGVHVGQSAWADPIRRTAILDLARNGQINVVQLDIKDEVGDLGYPSTVPLATTIGAKMDFYDARAALDELHALGVRVVGRIVCFLDPTLARWALATGERDYLVYDGSGATPLPSADYGDAAFTNFAHPDVQQYQIDLAVEAIDLGFDEILYDYVRRPEGDPTAMTFPGLDVSPEASVARFVQRSAQALDPLHAELGVSVFGIAATRPTEIGQDIRLLAPLVDYVAPMVYPQGWGAGEYGVERPNEQPYDIVFRSLADFHRIIAGSGAAVVPWLQDYTVGAFQYGEPQITAQLDATRDSGSDGYLLWNPRALYNWPAIQPIR